LGNLGEQVVGVGFFDGSYGLVQAEKNIGGIRTQRLQPKRVGRRALQLPEAASVPELVCEISSLFDLLLVKANVLAVRRDSHQTEPQTVRSVLCD
jgi:hypothetical protein